MRLPVNRASALTLAVMLTACGHGQDTAALASAPVLPAANGPSADYPVVIGQPFSVDGVTFAPEDKLNYDQVGYAVIGAGEGVSIAHRTLPLPSYAEVTSLETGRTILVRVTERGPMTGARLIALSPAASAQLGASADHTAIRIRRVNPPEQERAALRGGGQAPARMNTPISLVNVLRRRLDAGLPAIALPGAAPGAVLMPSPPIAPIIAMPAKGAPKVAALPAKSVPAITKSTATPPEKGGLVVQVGAFSTDARGAEAAHKIGGKVSQAGKYFRVRMGPFSTRGEAEAALAKAKHAGYSDARIQRAD